MNTGPVAAAARARLLLALARPSGPLLARLVQDRDVLACAAGADPCCPAAEASHELTAWLVRLALAGPGDPVPDGARALAALAVLVPVPAAA